MSSAAVRPAGAALLVCLVLVAASPSAPAAKKSLEFDPNHPEDALQLSRKMLCSLQDGKPTLYWWKGSMLSRVPGERDRVLFNVQGMNIRQCGTVRDEKRGLGYRSVSREVMLYLDPETNQVLRKWKNLWTGKEVDVVHVANDPVNLRQWAWTRDEQGQPVKRDTSGTFIHGSLLLEGGGAARLFYKNPLGGDFQDYVGGNYQAMEFGSTAVAARQALDPKAKDFPDAVLSWGRISRWLPWMEMGDRDGLVFFHTAGMRLDSWDQLPDVIRKEIELNYPQYREPPPIDDARPNETSWTVFKRFIEEKRAKEAATAPKN